VSPRPRSISISEHDWIKFGQLLVQRCAGHKEIPRGIGPRQHPGARVVQGLDDLMVHLELTALKVEVRRRQIRRRKHLSHR
jgi:hypothetical protein